jgi:hypothetical protein
MAFTRIHDDYCRIAKEVQESTGAGRYQLNVPGNGDKPFYMEDPCIRLQGWGGNLRTNSVELENDLRGLSRPLSRDCTNYKTGAAKVGDAPIEYPACAPFVEQPRATHPAWTARDLEQSHFSYLHLNPQEHVCRPFQNNLSTRILEKDYWVREPCSSNPSSSSSSSHSIPQNVFTAPV